MRQSLGVAVLGVTIFLAAREIRETYASFNVSRSDIPREIALTASNAFYPRFQPVPASEGATPREVADHYIEAHRSEWQIQPYHQLRATEVRESNSTKVKYAVFQDELPIVGIGIEIDVSSDLKIQLVQNDYRPVIHLNVAEMKVLSAEAIAKKNSRFVADNESLEKASSLLYIDSVNVIPELVYVLRMREIENENRWWKVMFRAKDGQVLGKTPSHS